MKYGKLLICLGLVFLLSGFFTISGQSYPNSLFTALPGLQSEWTGQQPHHLKRIPVAVNFELLENDSGFESEQLYLTGFNDAEYFIEITRVLTHSNGAVSVIGREIEADLRTFALSFHNNKVLASFMDMNQYSTYKLKFDAAEQQHFFIQTDESKRDFDIYCELLGIPDANLDNQHQHSRHSTDTYTLIAEIDLMVVYTPAAKTEADQNFSGINTLIAQVITESQQAADNSDVLVDFRLVHSAEVNYTEVNSAATNLSRLIVSPTFNPWQDPDFDGYMDEVHDWRDDFGADLVTLLAYDINMAGLAPRLDTTNGRPRYGFSIVNVEQATNYTFAHEIGHLFGNHHSRLQNNSPAPPEGGLFQYSTGWRWTGNSGNHFASVMTYHQSWWPWAARVPLFSNPDVNHDGVPSGSYSGTGAPADATRSMNEVRYIIEDYRPTQVGTSVDEGTEFPMDFVLSQNYPNPFNPATVIEFTLPYSTRVILEVYDMTGRKVTTILNETKGAGTHNASFDASGLSSGIYIYRLSTDSFALTRKMVLVK